MRAVTPITLVMPYYENPGMLQAHYDALMRMSPKVKDLLQIMIVDDGSPDNPAFPPKSDLVMSVAIFRITVDVRWNQDAARNIGVAHAQTNWVLMTDIDHMVPEPTWKLLLERDHDPGTVYRFRRVSAPDMEAYKSHPNTWLMTRKMFDACGGYDERFAGYYGTDGDFRDRVQARAPVVMLKECIIRVPRQVIPDASTTRYLRKQPKDGVNLARIKHARSELEDPSPLRLTFPYEQVYP